MTAPVPVRAAVLGLSAAALLPLRAAAQVEVAEATVEELQEAMASGAATSEQITAAYLARIEAYDQAGPRLNAMIRLNPDALAEARALDEERSRTGPRGPLHGIPVILKDNYDVAGRPTSGGSLALAGLVAPDDAFQVAKLREAGAVFIGKSNLHELASGITTVGSLGGQTLNPYDVTRNPGGSSGGTGAAIAVSFAAVGWGSDTCGSIRIPASQNNLVGLRPTKGLSSTDGILPLSHTQDVGGPLARTARDLAVALEATVGPDPADPATGAVAGREIPRFMDALDPDAFTGARIGILEDFFGETQQERSAVRLVREVVAKMVELGADTLTVDVPDLEELLDGSGVISYEFKWDLVDYLAGVPGAPVDSLGRMLELGLIHQALVPRMRDRDRHDARDSEEYLEALGKQGPLREAVVAAMDEAGVDALVYPTMKAIPAVVVEPQSGSNCSLSANTGLPALSAPAGLTDGGLPMGYELLGRAFDDARLLGFAYAVEQATDHRHAPPTTPPLVNGMAPPAVAFNLRASSAASGTTGDGTSGDGTSGQGASSERVAVEARARFEYDPVLSRLGYQIGVYGVDARDVFAVVLRAPDAEGRWSVVRRLIGPEEASGSGELTLTEDLRRLLAAGNVHLEVYTRQAPLGAARARLPALGAAGARLPPSGGS